MIQIAIVIILTSVVLRQLFSFKTKKDDYSTSTDELKKEFRKRDILFLLGSFLLIPLILAGLTMLNSRLSDSMFTNDLEIIHLIKPNTGTWFGMAMISSPGVFFWLIFLLSKIIFKEQVYDYWIYYNRKYSFNGAMFLKYFAIIALTAGSIFTCMNLNSFVKIKEDRIEINSFTGILPKKYSFDSINEITHYRKQVAPNGKIVDKPYYSIVFSDNSVWRTDDDLRTPRKSDEQIIKFLSEETKIEIDELEIDKITTKPNNMQ